MPAEQHEFDDRFLTGEWKGFFVQPDSRQRHAMELVLEFAGGTITGFGVDRVGKFAIRGTYDTDTGQCSWLKQYLGQHGVDYAGQARQRGHHRAVADTRTAGILELARSSFGREPTAI